MDNDNNPSDLLKNIPRPRPSAAAAKSLGTANEKSSLLECLDIVFSLHAQWDVIAVRRVMERYKVIGNTDNTAGNFSLNFGRFCDVFQVPVYDDVRSEQAKPASCYRSYS